MKFTQKSALTFVFLFLLCSTMIASQPLFNKSKAAITATIAGFFTLFCCHKELSCFEWMKYQESIHKRSFKIPVQKDSELKPVDLPKN